MALAYARQYLVNTPDKRGQLCPACHSNDIGTQAEGEEPIADTDNPGFFYLPCQCFTCGALWIEHHRTGENRLVLFGIEEQHPEC